MTAGLYVQVEQDEGIPLHATFSCAAGQMLALVGPSGAGKTSLLRIVAGLLKPSQGVVRCGDAVWLNTDAGICVSVQERRIGFVFQQYALFPHLTALENIAQSCRELPADKRGEFCASLLTKVNLHGLGDRLPAQLSGGQQQRVGIARALARQPSVLLLDEPFSAVDKATRERLYQELAALRHELSIPVVLVTHDLTEAMVLSDQLCMLSQGRTLQAGPVAEVLAKPVSVLVARLIGFKNIFRGTVLETSGERAVVEWRGLPLEVSQRNNFNAGDAVHWCIPQSHLILHRRNRPSKGERENPVTGSLADVYGRELSGIGDCRQR